MSKILILANSSSGLYDFRNELLNQPEFDAQELADRIASG